MFKLDRPVSGVWDRPKISRNTKIQQEGFSCDLLYSANLTEAEARVAAETVQQIRFNCIFTLPDVWGTHISESSCEFLKVQCSDTHEKGFVDSRCNDQSHTATYITS